MDIWNIGSVASAYWYVNQIRNRQVSSNGFVSSLQEATSTDDKVVAYKKDLEEKYGVPIMVTSVGKDQNSMDRFAGGTLGSGNVAIAPNILEQMFNSGYFVFGNTPEQVLTSYRMGITPPSVMTDM